ncbi:MAG: hypothetical protein H6816_00030 [Phycisphaerales bacterium]|nr:hypothetical protein [Phycisphaerales bacterium]
MTTFTDIKKRVARFFLQLAAIIAGYLAFCLIVGLIILPSLELLWFLCDRPTAAAGSEGSYHFGIAILVALAVAVSTGVIVGYSVARRLYFFIYRPSSASPYPANREAP